MATWEVTQPALNTRLKDSPAYWLDNWDIIELWSDEEHGCISGATARTSGSHRPGFCGTCWTGPATALTAFYNYPPCGSWCIGAEGSSGAYIVGVCTNSGGSGTWTNYTPSHLCCQDLACGHPHPQYWYKKGDEIGTITVSGNVYVREGYLSACSATLIASGSPTCATEAATYGYLMWGGHSPTRTQPYWTATATAVFDSGYFHGTPGSSACIMTATQSADIYLHYLYGYSNNGLYIHHSPNMTMSPISYGFVTTNISATRIGNAGNRDQYHGVDTQAVSHTLRNPAHRIIALKKTAGYDTGWVAYDTLSFDKYDHSLGATPDLMMLYISDKSDGSSYCGISMAGNVDYNGTYGANIVSADGTSIIVGMGNKAIDCYTLTDVACSTNTAWYRAMCWKWTPTYNSGLSAISTTNNEVIFNHNLGKIPILYQLLYYSDDEDPKDTVPIMAPSVWYNTVDLVVYQAGVYVSWTEKYCTVRGGTEYIAAYRDGTGATGTARARTSGYIALKAWVI